MSVKPYFEGWYYKQQTESHTLTLIPGCSGSGAFIQVITEHDSYNIAYDLREYKRDGERINIGGSDFSPEGVTLSIHSERLILTGELRYSNLSPISGNIMGPFRFFPMECRHGILSMLHNADGEVSLNGQTLDFINGSGYIESDSGRSFPSEYMWVQCNDSVNSVMASVARIPFMGFHFWGCIAVVWLNGREYRLATYRGTKIVHRDPNRLILRQGRFLLEAEIDVKTGHELFAPMSGSMNRTIRESAACPAHFRFTESGRSLLEMSNTQASYEYDNV